VGKNITFQVGSLPRLTLSRPKDSRKFVTSLPRNAAIGISQLEAIMYDDIAFTYLEEGDSQNATTYISKALELAQLVGGDFPKDWLSFSNRHVCGDPALEKYC
jgi:hypothetical protein